MLTQVRAEQPIIHCITNHVVSNFQANGLLSLGVSPIMGEAPEEAAELASLAGAVSLNIGTLNETSIKSMLIAGKAANEKGIPVVLDPVGAGATPYRLAAVKRLMEEVEISVLRCNAGELAAIMGADWQSKGVDAGAGEADVPQLAQNSAQKLSMIIAVTGKTDIVTDGDTTIENPFGDPVMTSVTGMGCLLSAVVAAFLAVSPNRPLAATAEAIRFYAMAGEKAAQHVKGPGSFQAAFLDALSTVRQSDIDEVNRMEDGAL